MLGSMIEFFVPMELPTTTHQQKKVSVKNGQPRFYEPDDVVAARAKFMAYFSHFVPPNKLKAPLRLTTKWIYPMKKGTYNGQWKITKPDTDNIIKLPQDCLAELGFFENDAGIASNIIEKFWGDPCGVYVKLEELE